ncbi:spliceosomal complex disassembly protein [Malassezia pachydermatis]|uniref:Gcfc-domain-containing protein n=1 Tax=Malassezia pachydermatis TaxID=77020 RepID=A0A0M8MJZ6_9BASI|nr:gcfc-domain-containing protein [Malassezia pachydermatis]KOS14006.1 gcfc-domain-containing protein [Malassezia pachydermatis]
MEERSWREQLQQRYGDQQAHTSSSIATPDSSLFRKKRRSREQRAALLTSVQEPTEDDFVSLDVTHVQPRGALTQTTSYEAGPHPSSRLPREEDEIGLGEDEHAAYTEATERIPLGRQAERQRKMERRRQMRTLIDAVEGKEEEEDDIAIVVRRPRPTTKLAPGLTATPTSKSTRIYEEDAFAMQADALPAMADAMEEDQEEAEAHDAWERAQLQRMGLDTTTADNDDTKRSSRPSAPVPMVAALPTPTSCLARIQARLTTLSERATERETTMQQAEKELQSIETEETTLKEEVEALETKAAWMTEMEAFIETVATFLDVKSPMLETLEHNSLALLVDRTLTRQRARWLALEDAMALVYGVSSASLEVILSSSASARQPRPMDANGAWNDPRREERRRHAYEPQDTSAQWLTETERRDFLAAKADVLEQQQQLLADVQAAAFRDPAAPDTPDSLVERFHTWRERFTKEYDLAWGGLALANVWEFWARYEMAVWDPCWCAQQDEEVRLLGPPAGLDGFAWEHALQAYMDRATLPRGGDEEALSTLVANTVAPRLTALAEQGAYDPWSLVETQAMLQLVEQASYLLDNDQWRYQAMLRAYLHVLEAHTQAVANAMRTPPTYAGAPMHPDTIIMRQRIVHMLYTLALSTLRWGVHLTGPHAPAWKDDEGTRYEACADNILSCVWNAMAEAVPDITYADLVSNLCAAWPAPTMCADLYSRFTAWQHNAAQR